MKYTNYQLPIEGLIELIEKGGIDLKPPYQRNEVWTKKDQESLIDSILSRFPLPNLFFFKNDSGRLEMVDGQQRVRAIYSFYKGFITDTKKRSFEDIDKTSFLSYELNVTEISEVHDEETIRKFYVLVNKKGVHLNLPEIRKAEFAATNFLSLVERILESPIFSDLDLFSDSTAKRMNDRGYVEELVAYLVTGITDKKNAVENLYKEDISEQKAKEIEGLFIKIVERISFLDKYKRINETRYKQRNDFYTLFNFVSESLSIDSQEILLYQYQILLCIAPHIAPSNDICQSIQQYAYNCVTQSNSKKARTERLEFFNSVLRNKDTDNNPIVQDVYQFLIDSDLIKGYRKVNGYTLFDLKQ
jgi:hypothetical protein